MIGTEKILAALKEGPCEMKTLKERLGVKDENEDRVLRATLPRLVSSNRIIRSGEKQHFIYSLPGQTASTAAPAPASVPKQPIRHRTVPVPPGEPLPPLSEDLSAPALRLSHAGIQTEHELKAIEERLADRERRIGELEASVTAANAERDRYVKLAEERQNEINTLHAGPAVIAIDTVERDIHALLAKAAVSHSHSKKGQAYTYSHRQVNDPKTGMPALILKWRAGTGKANGANGVNGANGANEANED